MLPRSRRVPKSLFPIILKQGRAWFSPFLSLRVWRQSSAPFAARFSVVVSNKVSNRAAQRNLWKRRGRAALTKLWSQIKDNNYCLLYLKPAAKSLSYSQLVKEIKDIFHQARLLSDNHDL